MNIIEKPYTAKENININVYTIYSDSDGDDDDDNGNGSACHNWVRKYVRRGYYMFTVRVLQIVKHIVYNND